MGKPWTLILAAGASQRFGSAKALAPWENGTLLSHAIQNAQLISESRVLVVLGGHAPAISAEMGSTHFVYNENWQRGLGTSIAKGVASILEKDSDAEIILVLPVDQPLVPIQHLEALIETANRTQKCILTQQGQISGPPIAIPPPFYSRAQTLNGDKGMKAVLQDFESAYLNCELSLHDIDTVEDLERLQPSETQDAYFVAASATQLSLIEIVIGSVVHAFKIPFGGHILSLNQGLFLCYATVHFKKDARRYLSPLHISSVSAVLKSLSPAGQKLGPMISISFQGALYSLGVFVFGGSKWGQSIGMMLLSLWAFFQPILTLWIFYGKNLESAALFYYEKLQTSMPGIAPVFVGVLVAVVLIKVAIAASLPWVLARIGYKKFEVMTSEISKRASTYQPRRQTSRIDSQWQALRAAFRDLLQPGFLIPTLLVTGFLVFSETRNAQLIWQALRPLAIATIFFYISHSPWMHKLIAHLREKNYFPRFFAIFDITLKNLNSKQNK